MYEVERAKRIQDDLKKFSVISQEPIETWQKKDGFFLHPKDAEDDAQKWQRFVSSTDTWGSDSHAWFKTTLNLPAHHEGQSHYLEVKTDKEGWDAINPQMLLFIDGAVVQGFDTNHREIALSFIEKKSVVLEIQAYRGRNSSPLSLNVSILTRDCALDELFYHFNTAISAAKTLSDNEYELIRWKKILTHAVNLIDLRHPHSAESDASIKQACAFFRNEVFKYEKSGEGIQKKISAACIGHTHIDIAWWWTVEQTRQKAVRSFATVLKLMDEYPDYKFMSSQPFLYHAVKERYPEVFEQIQQRVQEGRWEPEGGMWVEADCNLPSGESFIRQFLHGTQFFKNAFGKECKILWLPDVFGYSASLPQICKKCGIDYFMTTKITWSQFNKLPYDTFLWKGLDGTELFTHFVTGIDYESQKRNHFTTYNGFLDPSTVRGAWERYQHKDLNEEVLISYGYGDGGGGPTVEMLEHGKRLVNSLPGLPQIRQSFTKDYFDSLYKRVKKNSALPTWSGELYLEYHRGTYTSMAYNKRSNRKSEYLLQNLEFFAVWASLFGAEYPQKTLHKYWQTVLTNQFHDILPGSSIKEVYEVTTQEYDEIRDEVSSLIEKNIAFLAKTLGGTGIRLFNTLSFDRTDVVSIPKEMVKSQVLVHADGTPLVQQPLSSGDVLVLARIPARSSLLLTYSEQNAVSCSPFVINDQTISTKRYTVRLSKSGQILRFYDKLGKREVLPPKMQANIFTLYEDKPMDYDNWDIDIYYRQKSWRIDNCCHGEWTETGPVRATYTVVYDIFGSTLTQHIHFYAHSSRIDFETEVDWHMHQHLLKVAFPVDLNTQVATCDIQFGNIERPIHTNTSWDMARFEFCAHKWIDLSESDYGVSLLNDCKYGHSVVDGAMELTLIKSGILPNPDTDIGHHQFTYAFYPHMHTGRLSDTHQEAMKLNVPAFVVAQNETHDACVLKNAEAHPETLISVHSSAVMAETTKRSEDGFYVVLRLYEYRNTHAQCTVVLPPWADAVFESDMLERPLGEKPLSVRNGKVSLKFKPFEIKTLLFKLRS